MIPVSRAGDGHGAAGTQFADPGAAGPDASPAAPAAEVWLRSSGRARSDDELIELKDRQQHGEHDEQHQAAHQQDHERPEQTDDGA